jgi:hypothetical protein
LLPDIFGRRGYDLDRGICLIGVSLLWQCSSNLLAAFWQSSRTLLAVFWHFSGRDVEIHLALLLELFEKAVMNYNFLHLLTELPSLSGLIYIDTRSETSRILVANGETDES